MSSVKRSLVILLLACVSGTNAYAGGCSPGEPCWEPPFAAPEPAPMAEIPETSMPPIQRLEPEQRRRVQEYYGTVGAGWVFLEKDEEYLGHQIYEARVGAYRFKPNVSAEFGFGYMPDVRSRKYPDPGRYRVDGDTHGIRASGDLLFHARPRSAAGSFDPYVSVGGGLVHYDKANADGHTDVFAETGVGAFIGMDTSKVFVKPDYRIGVVGSDTEVNQRATVAVGGKF
ncbi:MAG: hypothetical protein KDD62_01405 [Bdellovibrionales bacterium]|nr:hypothetical protein [Bdellovibrionales bacterium]